MAANLLLGEDVEEIYHNTAHSCQICSLTFQTVGLLSCHEVKEHHIQLFYQRGLLIKDDMELCFEEVRAQDFWKRRQKQLDEKRQYLRQERAHLEQQVARMSSLLKQPAWHNASGHLLEDPSPPPRPSCGTLEAERASRGGPRALFECAQGCSRSSDLIKDQEVLNPTQDVISSPPDGGTVNPCDPDLRRQLLERCDITSFPNFHVEARLLPNIQEDASVWLGGKHYQTCSRFLEEGGTLAYEGLQDNNSVIIKVDHSPLAWDFYMFHRLTRNSPATDLPQVQCFQFQDGCVTVYVAPTSHVFSALTERVLGEDSTVAVARSLLNLTSAMQASSIVHAAVQPDVLVSCHSKRSLVQSDWLFPLDWRAAVDLQENIVSLKHLPASTSDVELDLLDDDAPLQIVDLVGVAQTLHHLLTKRKMVPIRDGKGWTAEGFQQVTPGDAMSSLWCNIFRSLLNANTSSWAAVTSEKLETIATFHT